MSDCNNELKEQGKSYPRTCARCSCDRVEREKFLQFKLTVEIPIASSFDDPTKALEDAVEQYGWSGILDGFILSGVSDLSIVFKRQLKPHEKLFVGNIKKALEKDQ